jgi:hypothetical protein
VQTLGTPANGSQLAKRIEVMDQPGENRFAGALAKALGPTAKDPTARAQIVSLVSRLEPEAASTYWLQFFKSYRPYGPATAANDVPELYANAAICGRRPGHPKLFFNFWDITAVYCGNIPPVSSNPGTKATGGGTQDAPTPTYNSKTLATLLKNNILIIEQVSTICGSQGIAVKTVKM